MGGEDAGAYALTLRYRACDFSKLSPSPFPLPSREGDLETLSPGGRGEGEGEYENEISHLKLGPMGCGGIRLDRAWERNV